MGVGVSVIARVGRGVVWSRMGRASSVLADATRWWTPQAATLNTNRVKKSLAVVYLFIRVLPEGRPAARARRAPHSLYGPTISVIAA